MKIHPLPRRRNLIIQYGIHRDQPITGGSHKKLRRLPHIFARVLELPFRSDADVSVEESTDCFKFVVETDDMRDVRAHAVEIHPGITKIVVRENGALGFSSSLSDLELDVWRFRLPESTRPELARAAYVNGELVVTIPKGAEMEDEEAGGGYRGGMENNNRLVLVV